MSLFLHVCISSPVRFPVSYNDCNNIFITPLPSIRGGLSEMLENSAPSLPSLRRAVCAQGLSLSARTSVSTLKGSGAPCFLCAWTSWFIARGRKHEACVLHWALCCPVCLRSATVSVALRMNGSWEYRFSAIMPFS